MSSGVLRKQYTALAGLAEQIGTTYTTPTGSFNEKFCELCRILIVDSGGTFTPIEGGSFLSRKAGYLRQLAVALGASDTLGAQSFRETFLNSAKAIWDLGNDEEEPDQGATFDWRVYQYLLHSILGPADAESILQHLDGYNEDGTFSDKVSPLQVDSPVCNDINVIGFNGSTSKIETNIEYNGTDNLVFSCNVYPDNLNSDQYIISDRNGSSRNLNLVIVNTSGIPRIQVETTTGYQAADISPIPALAWSKIDISINVTTGEYTTHLNGSPDVSGTFTGDFVPSGASYWIGEARTGGARFSGLMHGVSLNGHFNFPLQEGSGSIAYDIERNGAKRINTPNQFDLNPYPNDPGKDVVHPDVWVFDTPWNGYTHWMAYTPYPSADNQFENPSIEASNDGVTWETPTGLTNPLVPSPSGSSYNSDTELLYDDGKLKIIYREFISGGSGIENLRIIESSDGVSWTSPVTIISEAANIERLISPTITNNNSQWVMVYWDAVTSNLRYRTSASLESGWSASSPCTVLNAPANPWHQKMRYIDGKFVMYSQTGSSSGGSLYYIESADAITWDYSGSELIISSIDGSNMYRSTFWPKDVDGRIQYTSWLGTVGWDFYSAIYDRLGNDGDIQNGVWTTADGIPSYNLLNGFRVATQQTAPYIPALLDGTSAADGNPITNFGGYVHNGAECSHIETDADFTIFGGANLMGNGVDTWNAVSYADYRAHLNGAGNVWLKCVDINGVPHYQERYAYNVNDEFTPAEVQKNEKYAGDNCGTGQSALRDVDGELITDVDGNVIFTA